MNFSAWILTITSITMVGCASTSSVNKELTNVPPAPVINENVTSATETPVKKANNNFLICKAKKSRFHYDWNADSLASGQSDQNSIRFEFRQANRPAGDKGENLKVGECGWAAEALAATKKSKSQVTFKSLSDEVTQSFYKLKTGKVFKVPVRQTKNGMMAAPGAGASVIR